MERPIRILQITATLGMGGIENFLMNLYRSINKEKVQFDFIVTERHKKDVFEDEILRLGGKIYKIPSIKDKGPFVFQKELKKIFLKNQYKVVHSHYNEISGLILKEAKKCGIKNRIAHSHNTSTKSKGIFKLYKKYLQLFINKNATLKFACAQVAGEWLYGKEKFKVINNGIISKNYKYDVNIRNAKRKVLKIKEEEIVIGHIGSFTKVKNQNFIVDIFSELVNLDSKYKLILIGDGELRLRIEKKVDELNLKEKVIFLGIRQDTADLLQVFDLFLFPSLFEGLPLALVEAQAAGLKCFVSDTISEEVDLKCNLINKLSLSSSSKEWAEFINDNKKYIRVNTTEKIKQAGYDSEENAKYMEDLYMNLYNDK